MIHIGPGTLMYCIVYFQEHNHMSNHIDKKLYIFVSSVSSWNHGDRTVEIVISEQ